MNLFLIAFKLLENCFSFVFRLPLVKFVLDPFIWCVGMFAHEVQSIKNIIHSIFFTKAQCFQRLISLLLLIIPEIQIINCHTLILIWPNYFNSRKNNSHFSNIADIAWFVSVNEAAMLLPKVWQWRPFICEVLPWIIKNKLILVIVHCSKFANA